MLAVILQPLRRASDRLEQVSQRTDHDGLNRMISRRVPLHRWREALERQSGDIEEP